MVKVLNHVGSPAYHRRWAGTASRASLGLLLSAILAATVSATPPAGTGASGNAYQVSWSFVADGQGKGSFGDTSWQAQRHISVTGSATVHDHPPGFLVTIPFNLVVTDDIFEVDRSLCYRATYSDHIVNPGQYTGGPDQFWIYPEQFSPEQRDDGSWYLLENPFDISFGLNGGYLSRDFATLQNTDTENPCTNIGGSVDQLSYINMDYAAIMGPQYDVVINGDATGRVFSSQGKYQVQMPGATSAGLLTMDVTYQYTIRRLGSCAGQAPPIDATNPIINDLQVQADVSPGTIPPNNDDALLPPAPAVLTVSVTCDGVPVKNAGVEVAVKAKDKSGGHLHTGGANPRPRGYLKGPGQTTYTQITQDVPSITALTNNKGQAKIAFRPGTDYITGGTGNCAGNTRGIAGTYEATVTLTDPRFNDRKATQDIEVKRSDFVNLPLGQHYVNQYDSRLLHPQGTSGTPATMSVIQLVANDFYNDQLAHNQALTEAGGQAWPVVPLGIIDISLQDGGLYDSGGTNVCAEGQPTVGFIPWQIPHQDHLKGAGVDIPTKFWNNGTAAGYKRFIWWRNLLRLVGCFYGLWAQEKVFHLDADQVPANWGQYHTDCTKKFTYEKPAVQSPGPAGPGFGTAAAAPDLFALVEPEFIGDETLFPAPGQQVSFTVSANNLRGTADAHAVELTATLPAGLHFVNAAPAPSRMAGASQPVWDLGTLAAGALPQVIAMVTRVDAGVSAGAGLTVTAEVAGAEPDAVPDNNVATGGVDIVAPGSDLALDAESLLGTAMTPGGTVTFTLDVLNQGNTTAADTALTLTLPASVTLGGATPVPQGVSGNTLLWDLGAMPPGVSAQFTVSVNLDPGLVPVNPDATAVTAADELTYTMGVTTTGFDRDPSNNAATVMRPVVLPGPDDQAWVSVEGTEPGVLQVGQDVTFTIGYANYGNDVAPTSTLTTTFDAGLHLGAIQPAPTRVSSNTLGWDLGTLAVGQSGDIVVSAHVDAVSPYGSITTGNIQSVAPDIATENNAFVDVRFSAAPAPVAYLPVVMR
jgi:uncharacterized repeat protein (TIGR01451 family)